jgi:hypothetical protein
MAAVQRQQYDNSHKGKWGGGCLETTSGDRNQIKEYKKYIFQKTWLRTSYFRYLCLIATFTAYAVRQLGINMFKPITVVQRV